MTPQAMSEVIVSLEQKGLSSAWLAPEPSATSTNPVSNADGGFPSFVGWKP